MEPGFPPFCCVSGLCTELALERGWWAFSRSGVPCIGCLTIDSGGSLGLHSVSCAAECHGSNVWRGGGGGGTMTFIQPCSGIKRPFWLKDFLFFFSFIFFHGHPSVFKIAFLYRRLYKREEKKRGTAIGLVFEILVGLQNLRILLWGSWREGGGMEGGWGSLLECFRGKRGMLLGNVVSLVWSKSTVPSPVQCGHGSYSVGRSGGRG